MLERKTKKADKAKLNFYREIGLGMKGIADGNTISIEDVKKNIAEQRKRSQSLV